MSDSADARVTIAVDRVIGFLDRFLAGVNFTRPGRDQSLGRDIAMTIVRGPEDGEMGGIAGRFAEQQTPDGAEWPENSDKKPSYYRSRKLKKYGWDETNRRTGQMGSQVSLYGRTEITADRITMRYGEDAPPNDSVAPTGYISDGDKNVTDVQKAEWAHQQGRDFYGFNQQDRRNVIGVAQENINQYIRDTNGR